MTLDDALAMAVCCGLLLCFVSWLDQRIMNYSVRRLDDNQLNIPRSNVREFLPDFDMNGVLTTDRVSFPHGRQWRSCDFLDSIGIGAHLAVCELGFSRAVGYMLMYVTPRKRIEIIRFAVEPSARRHGVTLALLAYARQIAFDVNADEIICEVPERLDAAQLALKSAGFVFRGKADPFEGEDVYRFVLSMDMVCGAASA